MNKLETLLQRYAQGTITPDEQAELNSLTHRDQILHAANNRAVTIRRRRRVVGSTVASLLIIVAACLTLIPSNRISGSDAPIIAQTPTTLPSTLPEPQIAVQEASSPAALTSGRPAAEKPSTSQKKAYPAPKHLHESAQPSPSNATQPAAALHTNIEPATPVSHDPIVACNTQCSPDSVINDIWAFLKA